MLNLLGMPAPASTHAGDIDQMHHPPTQDIAEGIGIIGQHRLHHPDFRLRHSPSFLPPHRFP